MKVGTEVMEDQSEEESDQESSSVDENENGSSLGDDSESESSLGWESGNESEGASSLDMENGDENEREWQRTAFNDSGMRRRRTAGETREKGDCGGTRGVWSPRSGARKRAKSRKSEVLHTHLHREREALPVLFRGFRMPPWLLSFLCLRVLFPLSALLLSMTTAAFVGCGATRAEECGLVVWRSLNDIVREAWHAAELPTSSVSVTT